MTKRPHSRTLAAQLHEWSDEQLANLLRVRPDLGRRPPSSIEELGVRAQDQSSIVWAIRDLTLAQNQLLQIVVCLRPDAPLVELERALPGGSTLADIEPVLGQLEARALVWRHGDRLHWSGALVLAMPSTLGPPFRRLIDNQSVDYVIHAIRTLRDDLRRAGFAGELPRPAGAGGRGKPLKAELVDELESLLAVPGLVDAALAALEPAARQLAEALNAGVPYRSLQVHLHYTTYGASSYYARYPEYQLYERGMFLPARNDGVGYLPREVGVALRGGTPVSELSLTPPEIVVRAVDQDEVDTRAGAVAASTLHRLADLLARWQDAPAKALKSGGIGVTVMKSAATALDVPVDDANLLAELLHLGGLLGERTVGRKERRQVVVDVTVGPSDAAEGWLDREPEVQWRQLASAWLASDYWASATGRKDGDTKAEPVLRGYLAPGTAAIRRSLLRVLLDLEPGQATERDALIGLVHWRRPQALVSTTTDPRTRLGWILTEAETLGIVEGGALSTFGRALVSGQKLAAERALAVRLPAAASTFTVQADLTAMAVGSLERAVLVELRLLADIESTGAATTFRFSESSLRRALDAGRETKDIHGFLERHAAKGVPKTLTFLINDVARRHGHLQVGTATSFVVSTDPAVLADAVSHRKTKKLGLRLLAPTVAVSAVTRAKMIDGLRDAGFFPTSHGEDAEEIVLTTFEDDWAPHRSGTSDRADPEELPQPFGERPLAPAQRPLTPLDEADAVALVAELRAGPRRGDAAPRFGHAPSAPKPATQDIALGLILLDAVRDGLVLGIEIDVDGVVEALVVVPVTYVAPVLSAILYPSGDPIEIHVSHITQTIVVGSTREPSPPDPTHRPPTKKKRR